VAAVSAIEAIRSRDRECKITVITKEKDVCYSRPLISYQGLRDEQFYYRDKKFFTSNDVKFVFDEAISFGNGFVQLKGDGKVGYAKLILTLGGIPIVPDIKGIKSGHVFTFTTYADAVRIKNYASGKKNAVIIGCGMIGIKAAEYLKGLGLNVTIVELMPRPFAGVLDDKSGKIVAAELKKNVSLILKSSVTEIKNGYCVLSGGAKVPADLVVCAIGVVPNTEIAAVSGIKVNKGIVVDEFMETSKQGVFAAGDCTEVFDVIAGKSRPLPIWPIAYAQGRVAGHNAAGGREKYAGGFVLNSVDVFGLPMITIGLSNTDEGESLVQSDDSKVKYRKVVVRNGKVIGAIFIGDINRSGIYAGLIRDGIDVTNFKADLLKENFGYIYVPHEYRSREVVPTEI
jgi:NAD(P)H-nitrite reductase large subunit